MRRIPNPLSRAVAPAERIERAARAAPGLLPTAEHLTRARGLVSLFPGANLQEVVLIRAPFDLPARTSDRVWLALECMQVTGSFKVRGALLAMAARQAALREAAASREESAPSLEVLAVSAGNHGIGVAFAAKVLGAKATVMVPRGAPRTKTDKIAKYGATVLHAQSTGYDDAELEAVALAAARGLPFLSPYDDLDVVAGNGSSLGFEIVAALGREPDEVLCPIGGGGLATGLACAMPGASVWGVQSEASCAFARSLETGIAVASLPPAATLAEGLEGGISERGFARAHAVLDGALVVTEDAIAAAMKVAYFELGLALEGSAAAPLAALLAAPASREGESASATPAPPADASKVRDVVVVLTGRNVDPERLARIVC